MEIDVAMGMLLIDPSRRRNRKWQNTFFRKNGVLLEDLNLSYDTRNSLDLDAQRRYPFPDLNSTVLSELFDPSYLEAINTHCYDSVKAYNIKATLLPIQRVLEGIYKN